MRVRRRDVLGAGRRGGAEELRGHEERGAAGVPSLPMRAARLSAGGMRGLESKMQTMGRARRPPLNRRISAQSAATGCGRYNNYVGLEEKADKNVGWTR
ncbi:MAG: hypothetical protein DMF97_06440 [Acidobacteria bacterium]|nr:MAG: hypothetical protein DMF97_06440 [Acidobacteriota bacterium]